MRLTRKDFKVETFTCGGPGGQHQNRSRSCVRITHIETGLSSESREGRSLEQNKKDAFIKLAEKLKPWLLEQSGFVEPSMATSDERIRTYNEKSNSISNTNGNITLRYDEVMNGATIFSLIEERKKLLTGETSQSRES